MNHGKTPVFDHLMGVARERGAGFFLLIDPDRTQPSQYLDVTEAAAHCGVDAVLVGTSLSVYTDFAPAVAQIKKRTTLPVIIFPGSSAQVTPQADAVLFTSLLSGRNPLYLIEEQVRGAPMIKRYGLEAIPTGYLLVESGALTTAQYVSATLPLPRHKADIACAHALAAQYLGMRLCYLDAGSGAQQAVPSAMVRAVTEYVEIPLIVGGGLRSPEACAECIGAGALFVVVGSRLEEDSSHRLLSELTAAVHIKETVTT